MDEVIAVTPAALELVRAALVLQPRGEELALWLEVNGIARGAYTYDLWFGPRSGVAARDAIKFQGEVMFVVPAESVARLRGSVLDSSQLSGEASLVISNPNTPSSSPTAVPRGDLTGPVARRVLDVLEVHVNPAISAHGGHVRLVGVEGEVAYVEMSGGCQGCGLAGVTLSQGIAVTVTDAVEEIREVVDVTDHVLGTRPYFEPGRVSTVPQSP